MRMRYIRNLLYQLKRQYGAKVTLYKLLAMTVDPKTGRKTYSRQVVKLDLAVVLPDVLARKFAYDYSFRASNREFIYGGQWSQGQRMMIIDGNDLPKDFTVEVEMSAVFQNTRYVVKTAERLDVGFGYLLTLARAENNQPLQILEFKLEHEISFGCSVAGAL